MLEAHPPLRTGEGACQWPSTSTSARARNAISRASARKVTNSRMAAGTAYMAVAAATGLSEARAGLPATGAALTVCRGCGCWLDRRQHGILNGGFSHRRLAEKGRGLHVPARQDQRRERHDHQREQTDVRDPRAFRGRAALHRPEQAQSEAGDQQRLQRDSDQDGITCPLSPGVRGRSFFRARSAHPLSACPTCRAGRWLRSPAIR